MFGTPFGNEDDMNRARMEFDDKAHRNLEVMTSFTKDQLVYLRNVFMSLAMGIEESVNGSAGFYWGWCTQILHATHGVCPVHSVDHGEEALAEAEAGDTEPEPS